MIYDKRNAAVVLGCLLKQPSLLAETDNYLLTTDDFADRLHKILFSTIFNMFHNGVEDITINEINAYLKSYPELYQTFTELKGNDAVLTAIEIAEVGNFKYYYDKLKKMSLLRSLQNTGFDIKEWYVEDFYDIGKRQELEQKLEQATIKDIIQSYVLKISAVESKYVNRQSFNFGDAADGIEELVNRLKMQPEIGLAVQGDIFTTISRGARKSKFYLMSARSGVGKALPNDTLIPTPQGWKTVGEIKVGDELFDRHGKPTKVLQVLPQGQQEVYELTFSDGRTALCNDQHLWSFWIGADNDLTTLSVRDILDKGNLKVDEEWQYKLPVADSVQYSEKDLPIDPYTFGTLIEDNFFVGQLLTGGTIFGNDKTSIPLEYLTGSIEQRFALLNGLLDVSGSIDANGEVKFCTFSRQLKNDFILLARSLGFIPVVVEERGKFYYTIYLQGREELKSNLFRSPVKKEIMTKYYNLNEQKQFNNYINLIKIERKNAKTEMTCFVVDNEEHLFLMNDFIVTHNSRYSVGQACFLSYPIRWNHQKNNWETVGNTSKSLIITTELDRTEIQTMIIAYLSGVNEENILNGRFNKQEEDRVQKAIDIMKYYKDNILIYHMPDPNVTQLNNNIRRLVITNNIRNVFKL
jgi:replicative DNA helicase